MDPDLPLNYSMNSSPSSPLMKPYRETIGKLNYLVSGTRPDIALAVNIVSRFQVNPGPLHWKAVLRIIGYLKRNKSLALEFKSNGSSSLVGFTDSDWARDIDSRRSTSGVITFYDGCPISWRVIKQKSVALSSAEAEYMAATEEAKELIYFSSTLYDLGITCGPIKLYEDNQSCIAMTKNSTHHNRSKHIDIRYHFIRDLIESKTIEILYVKTQEQIADIFTKPLPSTTFLGLRKLLKLKPSIRFREAVEMVESATGLTL
jgi:hypothetical protein